MLCCASSLAAVPLCQVLDADAAAANPAELHTQLIAFALGLHSSVSRVRQHRIAVEQAQQLRFKLGVAHNQTVYRQAMLEYCEAMWIRARAQPPQPGEPQQQHGPPEDIPWQCSSMVQVLSQLHAAQHADVLFQRFGEGVAEPPEGSDLHAQLHPAPVAQEDAIAMDFVLRTARLVAAQSSTPWRRRREPEGPDEVRQYFAERLHLWPGLSRVHTALYEPLYYHPSRPKYALPMYVHQLGVRAREHWLQVFLQHARGDNNAL